jgi:L-ascorbate metabolism protein UlaG (beta-lactamase superfamily)
MRVNLSRGGTEIQSLLVPPVPALDYKVGQVYSVHIQHPLGNLLVHGSAGFVPGALTGVPAEVVFLSVGGLAHLDLAYKQSLFEEVVTATGASRVIPLHYDDFTKPLEQHLQLLPRMLDDVGASLDFLVEQAARNPNLDFLLLPLWDQVDVFSTPSM